MNSYMTSNGKRESHPPEDSGKGSLEMTLELSQSPSNSTWPHARSQSRLQAWALPATHLVGPDQGLHSQVVLYKLAGLGPTRDCWPALREPWLSRVTGAFLTGFSEEAIPVLGRGRSKKTVKAGPGRRGGGPAWGPQCMLGVLSPL